MYVYMCVSLYPMCILCVMCNLVVDIGGVAGLMLSPMVHHRKSLGSQGCLPPPNHL